VRAGNCIEALQKKQAHVPYRNSKLTHILSASLGGHSKTLMLVACSPAVTDAEETACSLIFASRVRATELGVASKNVSNAPAAGAAADGAVTAAPGAAAAAGASSVLSSPPPKKAPSASPSSAVRPRAAAAPGASGSAIKKPAAAAPGSAVKKPLAK